MLLIVRNYISFAYYAMGEVLVSIYLCFVSLIHWSTRISMFCVVQTKVLLSL